MPTYVYAVIEEDDSNGEFFEVVQRMTDAPLTKHPENGKPVRRVILAPNVATTGWSDTGTKRKLGDRNLDRLGFAKYVNAGGGRYEKAAGSGPDAIQR